MKHKLLKTILPVIGTVIVLCCGAVGIYAADYYHMDDTAVAALADSDAVTVDIRDHMTIFSPDTPEVGLVFYPGGKVESTAYAPLMQALAQNGVLCVIPKMPLNLAVMDTDAADDILPLFPHIKTWYIGGHSLGGSMAASHAAASDDFTGLFLLAAYSTADLSNTELQVLTVYGSEDGVLNMEKYLEYYANLPDNTIEHIIDGGNHAQFGSYGEQEGDGTAFISEFEQRTITMSLMLSAMGLTEAEEATYAIEQYRVWLEGSDGTMLRSVLTLIPELKEFVLSEPIYSSRFNGGTYTVDNDMLYCTALDRSYRFLITEEGMVYQAEGSDSIYAHSSILGDSSNARVEVPNGTLYERK